MMSVTEFENLQLTHVEQDTWEGLTTTPTTSARRASKDYVDSTMSKSHSRDDLGSNGQEAELSIDLESLAERCMDDFDLLVEVIESFCEQCLTRVESLERSLLNGDTEQMSFDLDFLSGSAKNICAQCLDDSISRLAAALSAKAPEPSEEGGTCSRVGSSPLEDEVWRPAFSDVVMEFQRAVKYWKDFRIQTGNDDMEDMASTLRLESFLSTCTCSDGMENMGSNWSATEDELAQQRHIEDDLMRTVGEETRTPLFSADLYLDPDWNSPDTMDLFFEGAKQLMTFVRESWLSGRRHVIKGAAEEMYELSSKAGLTTLSRKLSALVENGPSLRASHIDSVDQQLDASIAIWSSCRLKI
mmetsp:Transcript_13926/g.32747  ORF Transcript_13926/g.32747 Transcript_13926/m.32747 type:complete len:357 (-) Transcript_13926:46-1116(-)